MSTPEPRRVVIAEDEALIRMDLAEMLAEEGYDVVGQAGDGARAVELAEQEHPDLVILDVQMPDMDGWETLRAVRHQHGDAVGVVLCTVRSHPADAVRAYELGCDAYLGKPFDIVELATIATTVGHLTTAERAAHRREALAAARHALEHT